MKLELIRDDNGAEVWYMVLIDGVVKFARKNYDEVKSYYDAVKGAIPARDVLESAEI